MKTKTKIEKQKKKERSYLQFVSPTLILKNNCPSWTYFGEETRNFMTSGSIWPYVKIYFL